MTDDNAEDDGYKALRSVWLSMPDEDPPDRGLAELMAAARVKADEMIKPSLWQRIAATLRRPPVLALATLMVVLGGAALIGRHRDKVQVAPTVSAPTPAREAEQTVVAGSASAAAPAPAPEAPAPEPAQELAPAGGAVAMPPPPPPPPPPREAPKQHASTAHGAGATNAAAQDVTANKAPEDKKTAMKADTDPQGTPVYAEPEAELAKDEAAPRADAKASTPPSAAALHKSARAAAARGDCAAMLQAIHKIVAVDMHYYETNVANDPKLVCKKNSAPPR